MKNNRRDFLMNASIISAGMFAGLPALAKANHPAFLKVAKGKKGPKDFVIVIGHADIWEFNARFKLKQASQNSPLRDFLLPRLLEGGIGVYIMPASGDSTAERQGSDQILEGAMRVIDMFHTEIAKTNGKASLILTKKDIPTKPDPNHV